MPRVSSKEKYTAKVFELFKERGLMLNMEQIATALGLTKKTLYNNYSSKQELISTVFNYFYSGLDSKIQLSILERSNAIDAFIDISAIITEEIDKLGSQLLKDISIYNSTPSVMSFTDRMSFYSKIVKENLQRGIDEGLYRENVNIDFTTLFYTSAIEQFYRWDGSFRYFNKIPQYHSELVKHHLYSVVNSNGIEILESRMKIK